MAVTPYCTVDHLESIWSAFGVAVRVDDGDAHSSTTYSDNAIAKATADVNAHLLAMYEVATLAASTWVTWCTAVLAAFEISVRRGNAPSQSLAEERQRYLESLKAIAAGNQPLAADDGLAPPRFDNTPGVSNLRVDSRFRANIRRVPHTSTESQQSPHRKGHELRAWPYPFPYN